MKVIEDHLPELNLSIDHSFLWGTPVEMKSYLMKNVIKFCLLLLDAETVKATSVNVPQLKVEYEELLKTATECVGRDICILIYMDPSVLVDNGCIPRSTRLSGALARCGRGSLSRMQTWAE